MEDRVAVTVSSATVSGGTPRSGRSASSRRSFGTGRSMAHHELLLTVVGLDGAAAVLAATEWCTLLTGAQVDLGRRAAGRAPPGATGLFQRCCSTRVDAGLPAADPVVDTLLGSLLPPAGEHTQLAAERLVQQARTLLATDPRPTPSSAHRSAAAVGRPGRRPRPDNQQGKGS